MNTVPTDIEHKPRFPKDYNPGIGVVGCGAVVKNCHLGAYKDNKLNVVGIYDINPAAMEGVLEKGVKRIFSSLDELLACDEIEVVDVAVHPAQRVEIMRKVIAAGKHVLAQKPLALTVEEILPVLDEAEKRGVKVAVNQNGRWSPSWRVATRLIEEGAIGEVCNVMHYYDWSFKVLRPVYNAMDHFVIYDFSFHWFDITRCWLSKKQPTAVRARDWRTPIQPSESKTPWGASIDIEYADGSSASIRSMGTAFRSAGCPFVIHGTEGTIRGTALGPNDWVELERANETVRYRLETKWFNDGFAGTMGELLCAIAEKREPFNSARHNLLTLQMNLAACKSAEMDGARVAIPETTK
jgi:predicted dehydrogenase